MQKKKETGQRMEWVAVVWGAWGLIIVLLIPQLGISVPLRTILRCEMSIDIVLGIGVSIALDICVSMEYKDSEL